MICHQCKVHEATINGLQEALRNERGLRAAVKQALKGHEEPTSMYIPVKHITKRGMSPRQIRNTVNGFVKD